MRSNVVPTTWSWLLAAIVITGAMSWPSPVVAADQEFEVVAHENVQYGTGADEPLYLDLYQPQGIDEPAPGLVFIHGGGWQGGRREDFRGLAADAAKRGYVTVTITYRLAPEHRFPAAVEDCKCAVRWFRAHAEKWNLDPDRIGAVGGSAGGHLAMMLGAMDEEDGLEGEGGWAETSSRVQGVVSYVGPTDLTAKYPKMSLDIAERFIGGPQQEMLEMYRRASPVTYVDADDPPMLLYQGTKDILVPYEQAFLMATALTKARVPGRVELIIGAGHGFVPEEMDRTLDATFAFFDHYLSKP